MKLLSPWATLLASEMLSTLHGVSDCLCATVSQWHQCMSNCRLAIIADDLSGALGTSAPFAARVANARVVISLEAFATAVEAWEGKWPEIIAVNTQSRHLKSGEAARDD